MGVSKQKAKNKGLAVFEVHRRGGKDASFCKSEKEIEEVELLFETLFRDIYTFLANLSSTL